MKRHCSSYLVREYALNVNLTSSILPTKTDDQDHHQHGNPPSFPAKKLARPASKWKPGPEFWLAHRPRHPRTAADQQPPARPEPCSSLVFGRLYHRDPERVAEWQVGCRLHQGSQNRNRGSPESSHQLVFSTTPAGDCWWLLATAGAGWGHATQKASLIPGPLSFCWEPGPCLSPLWELRAS
jgi:hypothetical protein